MVFLVQIASRDGIGEQLVQIFHVLRASSGNAIASLTRCP
jgi:hypothetical protein